MAKFDELEMWNQLQQYLESKVIVGTTKMYKPRTFSKPPEFEATEVIIVVKNTAPDHPKWPKIVFTGVSLAVSYTKQTNNPLNLKWVRDITVSGPFLDSPDSQNVIDNRDQDKEIYSVVSGSEFPDTTPDEKRFGAIIMPGQHVNFELFVPSKDIEYLKFRLTATVSRRHFFHFEQDLKTSS